jgi:hypothetical protein
MHVCFNLECIYMRKVNIKCFSIYYQIDQNKKNSKKLYFICIKKRLKYKNKFKKYKIYRGF